MWCQRAWPPKRWRESGRERGRYREIDCALLSCLEESRVHTESEAHRDWVKGEYCLLGHIAITKAGGGKNKGGALPMPQRLLDERCLDVCSGHDAPKFSSQMVSLCGFDPISRSCQLGVFWMHGCAGLSLRPDLDSQRPRRIAPQLKP